MPTDNDILNNRNAAWRALGKFGSIGFMFAACIMAGLAAGYTLDRHLDTAPWLTIVLLAVGIIAGFLYVFQQTMPRGDK